MNDRFEADLELPEELRALDAELRSIRCEERPSFGPELEAELAREWLSGRPRAAHHRRQLMAASVGALLLIGSAVPSARASIVRLVGALQSNPAEAADAPAPRPLPFAFELPVERPPSVDTRDAAGTLPIPYEPPVRGPAPALSVEPPVMPELVDRARVEALIRRAYPMQLQREGVGGTVKLSLMVDSTGSVDYVQVQKGSGVDALNSAAMVAAPGFRFRPARRGGKAIATWVEFDVVFEPNVDEVDPFSLPAVDPVESPELARPLDLARLPEWQGETVHLAPVQREAGDLLAAAIGDPELLNRLGPIESVLAGEAPAGVGPTQWRSQVSSALEQAMVRDPDNPAPLLALARIRRKQGLRTESRILFERGLQRALRSGRAVSPQLFAELNYERGTLIKDSWLSLHRLGRVPAEAFASAQCPQARSSGGASSGYASAERLIAWNYLCPGELGRILDQRFEPVERGSEADLALMMASFRAAVEAHPAHVGANVEILLALADEQRWPEMYEGARRFVLASKGHPYGLLLGGLALQRMSRSEDARDQFELALRGLPDAEVEALRDVRFVVTSAQNDEYRGLSGQERRGWEERFWSPLDPILSTSVNERMVEHLARASYAHLRFGSTAGDASEVWIRYGRPTQIRVVAEGSGPRTEFWDYGNGPDVTFTRLGSSLAMDLTSEGRAYLNDLREVLPHRYGTASRMVYTLPAQVTRFRGPQPSHSEVEIVTEVPELLATGRADTLDLGVFLLDASGSKLGVTQRRVLAEAKRIELRSPASPEVNSVVVEFYNNGTRQAAALREGVRLPEVRGSSVQISDLLVTESAAPAPRDVVRHAGWLAPYTLQGPVRAEALGVYFEVYDLAPVASWYRVRAEIVDRDSGAVKGVPIRPAGESGFRPTWDRRPQPEGATAEFLTVALSDIAPGRHILRVVVDAPEAGAALVAERAIDRR